MDVKVEMVCKEEPASPPPDCLADIELWFDGGNYDRGEIATKLLEDLDNLVHQDEQQLAYWLEEKTEIPIFEEVLIPSFVPTQSNGLGLEENNVKYESIGANAHRGYGQSEEELLLQEFEYVLNNPTSNLQVHSQPAVGPPPPAAVALTPPESPGSSHEEDIITLLQELENNKELDELVASRAESLYQVVPGCLSPESTSGQSSFSGGSSPGSHMDDSESSCDDPEWTPCQEMNEGGGSGGGGGPVRRRARGVGPEERRRRKKEQNKNAATRYRMKKKAEVEGIMDEEKDLKNKNDKLKTDLLDVHREIKYLKSLMRDVFRAKGLIK